MYPNWSLSQFAVHNTIMVLFVCSFRQRFSAAQCLNHDWLRSQQIVDESVPVESSDSAFVDSDVDEGVVVERVVKPTPKRFALVDDPNPPEAVSITTSPSNDASLLPVTVKDTSSKRKFVEQQTQQELEQRASPKVNSPHRGASESRSSHGRMPLDFYLRLPARILPRVLPKHEDSDEDKISAAQVAITANSSID